MSKILISGCGISFPGIKPTWVKVLKICGYDITDVSGPAISNQLITNQIIEKILVNKYDQIVCQLTSFGKLDVQCNLKNKWLYKNDSLRNFTHNGYWPSSHSQDHFIKKNYHDYLYSPLLEQQDLIFKLMLMQNLCKEKNIKLHIIQGYNLEWKYHYIDMINFDKNFNIYSMYKESAYWSNHDFTNQNSVPCRSFQIHLAKFIAKNYLKIVKNKLEKFHE
tara:strand:+ start:155 stop:814 length:660 start_codon:yes stop_codon:yes gene_type:complete